MKFCHIFISLISSQQLIKFLHFYIHQSSCCVFILLISNSLKDANLLSRFFFFLLTSATVTINLCVDFDILMYSRSFFFFLVSFPAVLSYIYFVHLLHQDKHSTSDWIFKLHYTWQHNSLPHLIYSNSSTSIFTKVIVNVINLIFLGNTTLLPCFCRPPQHK